ncbi:MAG: cell division protein ZapD [Pseudomonadota bacterium]
MALTAENVPSRSANTSNGEYEQPLTERLRTFLRLEFLYQQLLFHTENESDWSSRAAISSLLEINAILMRGDVRSEVLKELERQIDTLQRFQSQPGVDNSRLSAILNNLNELREDLQKTGPHFLQDLKDCEFLSAIKHRSAIPGGTCEFDLPDYSFWLRQDYPARLTALNRWIACLRPICDAVMEMMWLTREGAPIEERIAERGMFQYTVNRELPCRLLRVIVPAGENYYPEISGSQHRFTIRFMTWSDVDSRSVQIAEDINFKFSIC